MKSIPVTAAGVRIAAAVFVLFFAVAGCSLPPERPVTKDELYGTGVYSFYQIKESPESVLAALNREGEVILDARYRDRPVYIKILALSSGLQVHVIDR
nr:hypothetical protein [Geobacter anodireducens]